MLNCTGSQTLFIISKHACDFLNVVPVSFTYVVLGFYPNINSSLQTVSIPRQKKKVESLNNDLEMSPDLSFDLRDSLAE